MDDGKKIIDYHFSFATSPEGFDEHIKNSIEGYEVLNDNIVSISKYFVEPGTNIYDLGCSTGSLINALQKNNIGLGGTYYGIELCHDFKQIPNDKILYVHEDIRESELFEASFITCIFTLQFIPQVFRQGILDKIYEALNPGGGFVLAEKILANNSKIQEILTFTHYDFKSQFFDSNEILDKERTLRSMLKPCYLEELVSMLYKAGFKEVQTFWQSYLFVGILAIK